MEPEGMGEIGVTVQMHEGHVVVTLALEGGEDAETIIAIPPEQALDFGLDVCFAARTLQQEAREGLIIEREGVGDSEE
jgi:hypothetical protein